MTFGGFGVAYDAAVRALKAQERMQAKRADHRAQRQKWIDRSMSRHLQHESQADALDEIEAQLQAASPIESDRRCPECKQPFVIISAAGKEIDSCVTCGSFWFDKDELRALTRRAADIQTIEGPVGISRYACPVCGMVMQQQRFLCGQDLIVDKCPEGHGFYLERGELVRSMEL